MLQLVPTGGGKPKERQMSSPQADNKRAFVVLGMHKSGTTLVAEILHKAGISMEDGATEPGGYDNGQKMERARAQDINKRYLVCEGSDSHDILPPSKGMDPALHAACLAQARAMITDLSPPGAAPWGFKDPRTLLTLQLWQEAFACTHISPCLIGVYRNPVEVFGHYKRLLRRKWLHRDPAFLLRVLQSWCTHNRALLDLANQTPDLALFDFTALMTDEAEMQRLLRISGASAQDMRKAGLYRARDRIASDYRIARALQRLCGVEDPEQLLAELEKIRMTQIAQKVAV